MGDHGHVVRTIIMAAMPSVAAVVARARDALERRRQTARASIGSAASVRTVHAAPPYVCTHVGRTVCLCVCLCVSVCLSVDVRVWAERVGCDTRASFGAMLSGCDASCASRSGGWSRQSLCAPTAFSIRPMTGADAPCV
jgi:hypothetical protein